VEHWVPCSSIPLNFTVTTGVISSSVDFNPTAAVTNWNPRFSDLYEEFRIMEVAMTINSASSTNSGIFRMFWDEKSSSVPTAGAANERGTIIHACSDLRPRIAKWLAKDLADLDYIPILTSVHPVYFKLYTDSANYGSPIVATMAVVLTSKMRIQFRGYITQ